MVGSDRLQRVNRPGQLAEAGYYQLAFSQGIQAEPNFLFAFLVGGVGEELQQSFLGASGMKLDQPADDGQVKAHAPQRRGGRECGRGLYE
jgi:hypothetical protein